LQPEEEAKVDNQGNKVLPPMTEEQKNELI
jgi:hypothetical protein